MAPVDAGGDWCFFTRRVYYKIIQYFYYFSFCSRVANYCSVEVERSAKIVAACEMLLLRAAAPRLRVSASLSECTIGRPTSLLNSLAARTQQPPPTMKSVSAIALLAGSAAAFAPASTGKFHMFRFRFRFPSSRALDAGE